MCSTFVKEEWSSFKDNLRGSWLQSSWDDHQKVLFFCILCTHLFNIFCNTESILCFIHQLVPCFCCTSIGTSFLFVRCICFPNWRSTSEPLHYILLSVKGLLKQSWLFLLTIKQFKGKKRALASGKRTERNAAKKRRCENQSFIPFSLEVEDKGERYHFVLSCCERRCRQWYFFDVLHVSRCWLPHFPVALRRSQRTWIWTNQMKKTSYM